MLVNSRGGASCTLLKNLPNKGLGHISPHFLILTSHPTYYIDSIDLVNKSHSMFFLVVGAGRGRG